MNTLYEITTGIGTYFVIAKHPTEATEKVISFLNKVDYGIQTTSTIKDIKIIATEYTDIRFVAGHYLLT